MGTSHKIRQKKCELNDNIGDAGEIVIRTGNAIRTLLGYSVAAALACCFFFALAWSEDQRIDDATCLGCHQGQDTTLAGTAHALLPPPRHVKLQCTSCHSGGAAHVEEPSAQNIGNPATEAAGKVITLCQTCHVAHAEADNIGFDPHLAQGISCVSCHHIHGGRQQLLADDNTKFCGQCHVAVAAEFHRRSNHPLTDGAVTCLSCHSFRGVTEPQRGHGAMANCNVCHPEQSGPYVYEHPATLSYAVEGGSCTECHMPHGSPNERLLKLPGSTLCLQCHGVPPLHRTKHSGLGTKLACMECHSEIHGSNHNRKFLDPDLGVKLFPDCFQSGCHVVDN